MCHSSIICDEGIKWNFCVTCISIIQGKINVELIKLGNQFWQVARLLGSHWEGEKKKGKKYVHGTRGLPNMDLMEYAMPFKLAGWNIMKSEPSMATRLA